MRLTDEQFSDVRAGLKNVTARVERMARAVLVDGMPPRTVATQEGVRRQAVYVAVNRFQQAFLEQIQCPLGWEVVTVKLPPAMARTVRHMEQKALQERQEATRCATS